VRFTELRIYVQKLTEEIGEACACEHIFYHDVYTCTQTVFVQCVYMLP